MNAFSPFSDRGMITNRERFFGRKPQLQAAFSALAAEKPQCVCVLGEKRIGRSSFLYHLKQTYREWSLPDAEQYTFTYIDLSEATCETRAGFRAMVAKELFGDTRHALTARAFDDLLSDRNPTGEKKYVILLDEFPVLQKRKDEFNDAFYDNLRAMANIGDVTWVLATHQPLHEIALANEFSSTFFGIFQLVELTEFDEDEARDAVLRPKNSKPTTQLAAADFSTVSAWLGQVYHPLKVMIAADTLWQHRDKADKRELRATFDRQIAHAFGERITTERKKRERKAQRSQRLGALTGLLDYAIKHKVASAFVALILLGSGYSISKTNVGGVMINEPTPTTTLTPTATPVGTPTP